VTTVTPDLETTVGELGIREVLFISNELRYTPHGAESGKALPPDVESFIEDHEPVFVLVGALNPTHGVDLLLRSSARIRRILPHHGVLIIAFKSKDLQYEREIERLRTELDLAEAVLIPSAFENVAEALRQSDVFVRPTLSDGDSIAVREAMTVGLPVVASDVGYRPPGIILFPAGDWERLADALIVASNVKSDASAPSANSEKRTVDKFFDAYTRAVGRLENIP
jgi:glycosyltransferase involved in cell wall biosynthesis